MHRSSSLNRFDLCANKRQFQLKIIFECNQTNFPLKILIDCNFCRVSPSFAEAAQIPNKFNFNYLNHISSTIPPPQRKKELEASSIASAKTQHLYIFFLELYTSRSQGKKEREKGEIKMERFESTHSFSVISKPRKHIPKSIPKELNSNCQCCTIQAPTAENNLKKGREEHSAFIGRASAIVYTYPPHM